MSGFILFDCFCLTKHRVNITENVMQSKKSNQLKFSVSVPRLNGICVWYCLKPFSHQCGMCF